METILLLVISLLLLVIASIILEKGKKYEKKEEKSPIFYPWIEKLGSRKLWAAIGVFVTGISTAFHVETLTETQVETICYSISGFLAYILAEGYADGHSPTNKTDEIVMEGKKEDIYE